MLTSPSGRYSIEVDTETDDDGNGAQRFLLLAVLDKQTGTTDGLDQRHPGWFSLAAGWDAGERLWVRSGDTGMSVYELGPTRWERRVWAPEGPEQPGQTVYDVVSGSELPIIGGEPPSVLTEISGA